MEDLFCLSIEERKNMEIVFSSTSKTLSTAIKYFSVNSWLKFGRVSHSAFRFGGSEKNWMVESSLHGLLPNWWNRFKKISTVVKKYEIINIDEKIFEEVIEEFIDDKLYSPYDYLGILGMGLIVIIYWITGKKIRNFLGKQNSFSCTEFIYKVFKSYERRTGTKIFSDKDPEMIFPEDLLLECEKKPEFFRETTNEE